MMNVAQADAAIKDAERVLEDARAAVVAATVTVRRARKLVAQATVNFQAQFAPITRETLVRQFAEGEQQHRADVKAGRVPPAQRPRVADSQIDRTAFYGAGGDADDHARSQMRLGFRRGVTQTLPDGRKVLIPATPRRSVR